MSKVLFLLYGLSDLYVGQAIRKLEEIRYEVEPRSAEKLLTSEFSDYDLIVLEASGGSRDYAFEAAVGSGRPVLVFSIKGTADAGMYKRMGAADVFTLYDLNNNTNFLAYLSADKAI